jgi:hypothetical protein
VYDQNFIYRQAIGAERPIDLGREPGEVIKDAIQLIANRDSEQRFEHGPRAARVKVLGETLPSHVPRAILVTVEPAKADFLPGPVAVAAACGARCFNVEHPRGLPSAVLPFQGRSHP